VPEEERPLERPNGVGWPHLSQEITLIGIMLRHLAHLVSPESEPEIVLSSSVLLSSFFSCNPSPRRPARPASLRSCSEIWYLMTSATGKKNWQLAQVSSPLPAITEVVEGLFRSLKRVEHDVQYPKICLQDGQCDTLICLN